MERLTMEYCGEYVPKELCSIDRFGDADDCDLCCEYCKATEEGNEDCTGCAINRCFIKLCEYDDLEEQGKLLKLPCVVGDNIYIVLHNRQIRESKVVKFKMIAKGWAAETDDGVYLFDEFGKTVFLIKSEAQKASQKIKESGRT